MDRMLSRWALAVSLIAALVSCDPIEKPHDGGGSDKPVDPPAPVVLSDNAGLTYQLLVYSFADSDGDKVGDFKGITSKLDYIKSMGASGIWLSPIHPASSYHAYDVEDYTKVNPKYGTMDDFENLVKAAHDKGIKVYLDYVLNHSSDNCVWFRDCKQNPESPYRGFYHFNQTGGNCWYQAGSAYSAVLKFRLDWTNASAPTVTVTEATTPDADNTVSGSNDRWLYFGDGVCKRFYNKGGNIYELTVDFSSEWGFLIRTDATSWAAGTKFGAPTNTTKCTKGTPFTLNSAVAADITFSDVESWYYYGLFDKTMPDLNYGDVNNLPSNLTYQTLLGTAKGWLDKGVDGFRLDAVKHIYDKNSDNPKFLKQWYDDLNAYYKSIGHSDELFMVGENLSEYYDVAPYYAGLPAMFEFSFWYRVREAIKDANAGKLVKNLLDYRSAYEKVRPDYIAATKLSNHDEWRTGEELGKSKEKMKLAACVLLTAGGHPFIYQGEELGYCGNQNNGDEFVRNPMMWTRSGSEMATAGVNGKYDVSQYVSSISVEAQSEDQNSMLSLYRKLVTLRESYPAMVSGQMVRHDIFNETNTSVTDVAAWYRQADDSQKLLVIHNFGPTSKSLRLSGDKLGEMVFSNGTASANGSMLSLSAYSSAVFLLK